MDEFLRSELKKHLDSWLLTLCALIIAGGVVCVIFMSISKTRIFPKDNDRYDINTVYVGQMKDFCPKEFEANPGKDEFESCVPKLDTNKMVEVKIPTFKETLKTAPTLPYLLKTSENSKLRMAGEYFKEGNYFVVGIKIPEKYFSADRNYIKNKKADKEAADYNILTFRGMRLGMACIGDDCRVNLHVDTQNADQIPLILSPSHHAIGTVWIFGLENNSPMGIWLDDGVFVAKKSSLYTTYRLYGVSLYSKPMFAGIALIALFLVSLPFVFYLWRFFDYPAFSYFAASTALWFFSRNIMIVFPWLNGFAYRLFNLWVVLNFLLSVLILNLAYARFKKMLKGKYFVVSHLVLLILIFFVYLYFKDLGAIVAVWGKFEVTFAFIAFICAFVPLSSGIYILTKMLKNVKDPRTSTRLDYARRIKELFTYLFVWIVFCYSYGHFARLGLGTGNIGQFFTTSVVLFLSLLGIMIYHTHSKEITHMTSDPLAELERLNKRKSTRELSEIVKEPFEGVLLLLDMANSSGKDGREKRMVMEELLRICNNEANGIGYYANYIKPAGDDWKIIFIKKNKNIEEDLLEVTKFVVNNYSKFEKCIKDVFDDSSIHISVFALSDYRIYINEKQEAEFG